MEPKNEGLEDVFPFHIGDSQVPYYLVFRAVFKATTHFFKGSKVRFRTPALEIKSSARVSL